MGISYLDALLFGKHEIRDEGSVLPQQGAIDFRGAGVTVTDDPATGATRVTIESLGGGGYNRIQDEGANFPQRATLDFHGFELFDDPTLGKTIVQIGTPSAVNDVLGWSGTKWTARNYLALGASPATIGAIRLTNGDGIHADDGSGNNRRLIAEFNGDVFVGEHVGGTSPPNLNLMALTGVNVFVGGNQVAALHSTALDLGATNLATTGVLSVGASPATFGAVRLATGEVNGIWVKNSAGDDNVLLIGLGAANNMRLGGSGAVAGASTPDAILLNAATQHQLRIGDVTQLALDASVLTLTQNLAMAAGKSIIMDGKRALLEGGSLAVGSGDFALVNHIATGYQFFSIGDDIGDTYASIHPTEGFQLSSGLTVDFGIGRALGGGSTATLGTIGGTGPTTAGQNKWIEIKQGGTPYWVPAWV